MSGNSSNTPPLKGSIPEEHFFIRGVGVENHKYNYWLIEQEPKLILRYIDNSGKEGTYEIMVRDFINKGIETSDPNLLKAIEYYSKILFIKKADGSMKFGGKTKTHRNRKNKNSRKNRRKSSRRS